MSSETKIQAVTHNGIFHTDDVFSAALLELVLARPIQLCRTRDEKIIAEGEYVFDVGGVYEPAKHRFDHHQVGGAGKRENGIPYAAFGLLWKEYGRKLCGSDSVAQKIEEKLVMPIDAIDNGVSISKSLVSDISAYEIDDVVNSFRPTWKEDESDMDLRFSFAAALAKNILEREIKKAQDAEEAQQFVDKFYQEASDKRIIIMDRKYPFQDTLEKYPEPLYVVHPVAVDDTWRVYTMRRERNSFHNRKDLPVSWAGKRDGELAAVTGVPDATFCHNGKFLAVAKSKEGALRLAGLAVKN